MILDQGLLKTYLSYNPESGEFLWLVDRQRARKGSVAGCICPVHGYRYIGIDYKRYRACRLAFLYMTGEWPLDLVDHIDRCRSNDAWANLRQATMRQNMQNVSPRFSSTSGVTGVSWQPSRRKWIAHITNNGHAINLGRFDSLEDAVAARRTAELELFTHHPPQA